MGPVNTKFDQFQNAVIAAARLPIYTFGEDHPFGRIKLIIQSSDEKTESMKSSLRGSIKNGWLIYENLTFGQSTARFAGDGKTKSFKIPLAKKVELHHWE